MDEVERFFHRKSSLGQKPSLRELIEFCRKRKIRWTRRRLRELKNQWMFTAMFSRPRRPQKHMGAAVQRYGLVQVSSLLGGGRERFLYSLLSSREQVDLANYYGVPGRKISRGSRIPRGACASSLSLSLSNARLLQPFSSRSRRCRASLTRDRSAITRQSRGRPRSPRSSRSRPSPTSGAFSATETRSPPRRAFGGPS